MDTPVALLKCDWEKNPEVWERRFIHLPRSYHQSTRVMATDNCQPDSILKHQGDGPLAHGGKLSWFGKWGVKTHPSHPLWEPGPHRWKQRAEEQQECIAWAPWLWVQCSLLLWETVLLNCEPEQTLFSPPYVSSARALYHSNRKRSSDRQEWKKIQERTMVPTARSDSSDSIDFLVYCSLQWGNFRCSSFSSSEWDRTAPSFPKFIATCSRPHS